MDSLLFTFCALVVYLTDDGWCEQAKHGITLNIGPVY